MLDICNDKDAALLALAQQRGLLSAGQVQRINRDRGQRSAALLLVDDGVLDAPVVRALRTELQQRSINHAFDGYELLGQLGAGGMSVVFKAMDVVSHRLVAIKVIAPRVVGDRLFIERFQREARSAAAVVHPHVIACHGLGETRGKVYMVLEYMAGGDLEALADRMGGRLNEQRVLDIAIDCASGLEAIHAHGLVHRDIKPSNIFLDENGRAKLADLGLAKSEAPDDQLTMPGMRVGSPGFMSPEQAAGSTAPDIRSDVYSLGATLYRILAGRSAFPGRSPLEIILKSLREEPPALRTIAPWVSPRVAQLVTRCMARQPGDRFQHPAELRHELEAVQPQRRGRSSVLPAPATSWAGAQGAGEWSFGTWSLAHLADLVRRFTRRLVNPMVVHTDG